MPYVFDHLGEFESILALSPFGLITDVDGTISPIAPSPAEARVSPQCREGLANLVGKLELVAAISGRPALETSAMVGVEGMVYIGNHGLERYREGSVELAPEAEGYRERVSAARHGLKGLLDIPGLAFEDKGVALAIHYRNCEDREGTRRAILERIADSAISSGLRILNGKMMVELRPALDVNKGTAANELLEGYRLKGGIYLGDDVTDIDAFRTMRRQGFLSIAVTADDTPDEVEREADFSINGVDEVARFLKWLAQAASR